MRKLVGVVFSLLVFVTLTGYILYGWIYRPNSDIVSPTELFISDKVSFEELSKYLEEESIISNPNSFSLIARLMKFDDNRITPGRYLIEPGLSNRKLITKLRGGQRDPINLTISSARTVRDIAGQASRRIKADSSEIVRFLTDESELSDLGLNLHTAISVFVPDTYEVFWNMDARGFVERMKSERDIFWNNKGRIEALQQRGMSREECVTLASIVEKETNHVGEKAAIAGVYLNRIKRGIPLQADPTVVFGVGDFTIRRVLNKHLEYDSPYNTYLYPGLPPGPICMPSKSSIDAVLHAEDHNYLFFCAKPGYNGGHAFARTNSEHERNARIYRTWLNKEGIRG